MSNPLSPTATGVTIGIDISKDRLDVHTHPDGTIRQFANDRAGHAKLITPKQPTRVVFEATGAYHRGVQNALANAGLPAVKVNPWQARRFAEATAAALRPTPLTLPCWPASLPRCSRTSGSSRTPPSTAWRSCSPPAAPLRPHRGRLLRSRIAKGDGEGPHHRPQPRQNPDRAAAETAK